MVGLVAVNSILRQRVLAPCVSTTYAVDVEVNVQIDKAATLDILRMTGSSIKVLLTVVPGTDAEWLETLNA